MPQKSPTDLGKPLLRVQDIDEQRELVVEINAVLRHLSQQLLYGLGRIEQGARARHRRRRPNAPRTAGRTIRVAGRPSMQMRATQEYRVPVGRDTAGKGFEGQAMKGRTRPRSRGPQQTLGRRQRQSAHGRLILGRGLGLLQRRRLGHQLIVARGRGQRPVARIRGRGCHSRRRRPITVDLGRRGYTVGPGPQRGPGCPGVAIAGIRQRAQDGPL